MGKRKTHPSSFLGFLEDRGGLRGNSIVRERWEKERGRVDQSLENGEGMVREPELINEGQAPIHVCGECLTMSFPWVCHHPLSCSPAQSARELILGKMLGICTESVLIALHCLKSKTPAPILFSRQIGLYTLN